MFLLNDEELTQLTGKIKPSAQCKQLRLMGVHHARRIDGVPIVTRDAVLAYTGMGEEHKAPERATLNLDW